jgi:hypothetical protein
VAVEIMLKHLVKAGLISSRSNNVSSVQPRRTTNLQSLRTFLISNTGRDPLALNWCIVHLFSGVNRNDFGLFAGSI